MRVPWRNWLFAGRAVEGLGRDSRRQPRGAATWSFEPVGSTSRPTGLGEAVEGVCSKARRPSSMEAVIEVAILLLGLSVRTVEIVATLR
jgi:hypothetical protein